MHVRDVLGGRVFEANLPLIERSARRRTASAFTGPWWMPRASHATPRLPTLPIPVTARCRASLSLVTDVTERVLADRRRQRDMDRYRALARSVPGVFVLLFDAELRYLIAEGQELETFGYRTEELEGRRIQDVTKGDLASELEPRYRAALAGREVPGAGRSATAPTG